jgi:two-component system CheB/CheR fusion protein
MSSPDRRLQVIDHELSATEFDEPRGQRLPIDFLFRSVAERLGDGFAVVLSGAGSDGALGVRAVKEAGGIILLQDPSEAEYASMPRSAIETGVADFVLPVRDLAERLSDLIRLKEMVWPPEIGNIDEEDLRRILAHIRVRTGHDFSKYKRSTVVRRIARRMHVNRIDTLEGYYDVIRDSPDEMQELLSDLLISVTSFFRDREAFEALAKSLPRFLRAKKLGSQSASGWPDALPGKRHTRWECFSWKRPPGMNCAHRFKCSVQTSTCGRSRQRERGAIQLPSRPM